MLGVKNLLHLGRFKIAYLTIITVASCLFIVNSFAAIDVKSMVKEANASLPMKLNAESELTSIELDNKTVIYNIRLINITAAEINKPVVETQIKEKVPGQACEDKNSRDLLDSGYSILYKYKDKDHKPITQLEVKLSDCKK